MIATPGKADHLSLPLFPVPRRRVLLKYAVKPSQLGILQMISKITLVLVTEQFHFSPP